MAKILCKYSGILFESQYFPISLTSGESYHPVFDIPLKKLWKVFPKWQAGELDTASSYLYFLALLKSTNLVEFRNAAAFTQDTEQIVSQNMESLYATISRIVSVRTPRVVFPRFVISKDTKNLHNVKHWMELWNATYNDFLQGLRDEDTRSQLQRREAALERLIKNPTIRPERYSHLLAQWASIAGNFPEFPISVNGSTISCSEYWQDIIRKCYLSHEIIQIPEKDIMELIEHCEQEIELGSIFSYHLFTCLREGLETMRGFFSIGSPVFSILGADDSVEKSNLQLLIDSAPAEEPQRKNYPTEFAFLKARMKWRLSQSQSSQSFQSSQ